MPDSNMTIAYDSYAFSKLKKIVFTQTSAGAAGNATSGAIIGTLLRVETSGGDGTWDFTIHDGVTNVFEITAINVADSDNQWCFSQIPAHGARTDHNSAFAYGVPVLNRGLLCTIANGGTDPCVITVIYRED